MADLPEYSAVSRLVRKPDRWTSDDLIELRRNIDGVRPGGDAMGREIATRLAIETLTANADLLASLEILQGSIESLNRSSTDLVSETNRLTRRILWLTVAAVFLALVVPALQFLGLI